MQEQSPSASAMVMDGVCAFLWLSVVRRVSCVGPASSEMDEGTRVQLNRPEQTKRSAASLTGGFSPNYVFPIQHFINAAVNQISL